jgi:hypothetical protein
MIWVDGDGLHDASSLLIEPLKEGLRVLIYAGDYDFMYVHFIYIITPDAQECWPIGVIG